MHILRKTILFFSVCLYMSCAEKQTGTKQITVKNSLNRDRSFETVEIAINDLGMDYFQSTDGILIKKIETGEEVVSQLIDNDANGTPDTILFQPMVKASSEAVFQIEKVSDITTKDSIPACYSRFVPERTDDYAWENNHVAFRTYGPTAQKMAEAGVKGGTLSSGIDAWLKRVEYPIINKWYQKTTTGKGNYHVDTGEGLDNFHVGISRGVGGIAKKVGATYHISRNFTNWKTLSTGPIRTSFVLTYADWDAAGNKISEEKKISLDYGSNLSKFEITLKGTDTISAGLTLHEKDGEIGINQKNGWVSYWEPHEDSELGTGIIVPADAMVGYEHYVTERKDESNLFAHINVKDSKALYYVGFGWKKSGQFTTKSEWESYLNTFAECLKNPLQVIVN